jgi:DNA-binding response OmpR family regulator
MKRILIIEDDVSIKEELSILLDQAGYKAICVEDFLNVMDFFNSEKPDLVLLDINLPENNGFSICMKIRSISKVPIIFITGRDTSIDELKAFSMGGDDYITKPYNVPILLARISSVLKRSDTQGLENDVLTDKEIELNLAACTVRHNGNLMELSKKEMKILHCLMQNKEKYVSRIALIEYLWDNTIYIDDNALSVNITRLREKLSQIGIEDYIQTKRGMGYKV